MTVQDAEFYINFIGYTLFAAVALGALLYWWAN